MWKTDSISDQVSNCAAVILTFCSMKRINVRNEAKNYFSSWGFQCALAE